VSTQSITVGASDDPAPAIETTQKLPGANDARTRGTLGRLLLILAGIVIGLSFGEVITRTLGMGHLDPIVRYNDRILKLKPHIKFMNYLEHPNLVETNNLGFHDHEREAANDKYRILFVGDSFVEGRQVSTDSLFTVRLEKRFAQDGLRIETINGGVPGTGTAYQYVLWKEFFKPNVKVDHLVLCFYLGNDLIDNNLDLASSVMGDTDKEFYVDSQGRIVDAREKPGRFKQTINYVRDHSVLFDTFYLGAYRVKQNLRAEAADNGAGEITGVDYNAAWKDSQQGTIAFIRNWKSELDRESIPFDIVLIDRPGRIYNKFEIAFLDKLQAICAQDQIGCLRLQLNPDPFETYSFDGIGLGHFNDKGHELAANELYDYFKAHHAALFNRQDVTKGRN